MTVFANILKKVKENALKTSKIITDKTISFLCSIFADWFLLYCTQPVSLQHCFNRHTSHFSPITSHLALVTHNIWYLGKNNLDT
jgi:hypothetical protein